MMPIAPDLRPARLREMDRAALRAYGELSGDLNPIHLDREAARKAGHPDLICHGMLAMTDIASWLTQTLSGWQLESLTSRFVAPMAVETRLTVSGHCVAAPAGHTAIDFVAEDTEGDAKVTGRAVFRRPD